MAPLPDVASTEALHPPLETIPIAVLPAQHNPSPNRSADAPANSPLAPLKASQAARTAADPSTEKPLSPAELKRRAKEEKATRRVQAKLAAGIVSALLPDHADAASGQPVSAKPEPRKNNKPKPKQVTPSQPAASAGSDADAQRPAGSARENMETSRARSPSPSVPKAFRHLPMARRIDFIQADKAVHPAILALGQQMAAFTLQDGIGRMEGTLLALKKVLSSYETPPGNSFAVHFNRSVLRPQIDYLAACRPTCIPMGHAISWVQKQISKVDVDMSDDEVKKRVQDDIDNFLRERVALASYVIAHSASEMVEGGETVLTFGHHRLVEAALRAAQASGRTIGLFVMDDEYDRSGRDLALRMRTLGMDVTYCCGLGTLRWAMRRCSHVFLGAEAMFGNGGMLARAGTADVAMIAADAGVRVLALCEMVSLSSKIAIDSLTYNEIDPEWNDDSGFRLLFDTTSPKYISMVVTELGTISPPSVTSVFNNFDVL